MSPVSFFIYNFLLVQVSHNYLLFFLFPLWNVYMQTLRISYMEVQIVNTRARRRAFIQAFDVSILIYKSCLLWHLDYGFSSNGMISRLVLLPGVMQCLWLSWEMFHKSFGIFIRIDRGHEICLCLIKISVYFAAPVDDLLSWTRVLWDSFPIVQKVILACCWYIKPYNLSKSI